LSVRPAHPRYPPPETLGGKLVFAGKRVLVRSLFEYVEAGETLEEFLRQFPSVRREQTLAVLDAAYERVAADADSA
jgi:uncharacterized protein (DUF433 family)